jgi:hypothetical protein
MKKQQRSYRLHTQLSITCAMDEVGGVLYLSRAPAVENVGAGEPVMVSKERYSIYLNVYKQI